MVNGFVMGGSTHEKKMHFLVMTERRAAAA